MSTTVNAPKYKGPLLMLIASFGFAGGGAAMKLVTWNALGLNGVRNLLGALFIGVFMYLSHHKLRFNAITLMGALVMIASSTTYTIANKLTTAGNTVILQYTSPIWIIILMAVLFHKKPSGRQIFTVFVVLVGIICFFYESMSPGVLIGNLVAVLCGLCAGVLFILNQFEKGDAMSSIFLGELLCGIVFSPFAIGETDFSLPVILGILFLGIIPLGFGYTLFSISTGITHPVTACLINGIEPILNPVLVALIWGEYLSANAIVGAVIVILAVLVYNILELKIPYKSEASAS